MQRTTPVYRWAFFFVAMGILSLLILIMMPIFVAVSRDKPRYITLVYELDTPKLSKREIQDLAEKFLIQSLQSYVPGEELDFTWECDETGIRVTAAAYPRTIEKLKKYHKIVQLQLPAYLRVKEVWHQQQSAKKLQQLQHMLFAYANKNDGRFPDDLEALRPYDTDGLLPWLRRNLEYLGKGKTLDDRLTMPLAYDRRVLQKGNGTNVLFLDRYVGFEKPAELEKLGIRADKP
jgi:hypothetical protein